MNEVYAVDPAAPTDSKELRLLLKEFGFDTGRFIAEFPLGWIDEVRAAFARATEMERKRVIQILEKRRPGLTTREPSSCRLFRGSRMLSEPRRSSSASSAVARTRAMSRLLLNR